jgi:hypothetical protein
VYLHAARWIPLAINPFMSVKRMIWAGISVENDDDPELWEKYVVLFFVSEMITLTISAGTLTTKRLLTIA